MERMDAERLRRWKCLYCGSREKNIVDMKGKDDIPTIKIVTCNQCGHTDFYAASALAMGCALKGKMISMEESEKFVNSFIAHEREIRDASGIGPGNIPYDPKER